MFPSRWMFLIDIWILFLCMMLSISCNDSTSCDKFDYNNDRSIMMVICEHRKYLSIPNIIAPEDLSLTVTTTVEWHLRGNNFPLIPRNGFSTKVPTILHVVHLNLENCDISQIEEGAFDGFAETLDNLDLSHNKMTAVPTSAIAPLKVLQYLRLNDNPIKVIGSKAFFGLTNLKELFLEGCRIAEIQPNAFASLAKLNLLRLEDNKQLIKLSMDLFTGLNILNVDLQTVVTIIDSCFHNSSSPATAEADHKLYTDGPTMIEQCQCKRKNSNINPFYLKCTVLYLNELGRRQRDEHSTVESLSTSENIFNSPAGSVSMFNRATISMGTFYCEGYRHDCTVEESLLQQRVYLTDSKRQKSQAKVPSACKFAGFNWQNHLLIDCANRKYSSVPDISTLGVDTFEDIAVDLSGNNFDPMNGASFLQSKSNIKNIVSLNLTSSNIRIVEKNTFKGFKYRLTILDLSHNRLTSIPGAVNSLKMLLYLSLSSNPIERIPPNSFSQLGNLTYLSLSSCQIHTIATDAFKGLEKLTHLRLDSNKITIFSTSVFGGLLGHLDRLNLMANSMIKFSHCRTENDRSSSVDDDISLDDCQCYQVGAKMYTECLLRMKKRGRVESDTLGNFSVPNDIIEVHETRLRISKFTCGNDLKVCEVIVNDDGIVDIKLSTKTMGVTKEEKTGVFMLKITDEL